MKTLAYLSLVLALLLGLAPAAHASATWVEWNFNGNLDATYGSGTMSGNNITEGSDYSFGTTTEYGIGALPNDNGKQVLHMNAFEPNQWLNVVAGAANNGGTKVNQYTIIMDVMFESPHGDDPSRYVSLLQTDPTNGSDADMVRSPDGYFGYNGFPTNDAIPAMEWVRVALVVNGTDDSSCFMRKYIDGTFLFPGLENDPTLDGQYGLDPLNGFLLFADNSQETGKWYVSSVFFADEALDHEAVMALGGADAAGILLPEPATMVLLAIGGIIGLKRRR